MAMNLSIAYTNCERALKGMKAATVKSTVALFCAETIRLSTINPSPALFNRTWGALRGVSGCAKYPQYVQECIGLAYDKVNRSFSGKMSKVKWDAIPTFHDWLKAQTSVKTSFDKLMSIIESKTFSLTADELAQVITALNANA